MTDVVDPATRSRMMSGIKGKNTAPEMQLRQGLHRLGFRYRIHESNLPGKPDLVFASRCAVIMVHGCFWHHHDCHLFKWPSTRTEFWHEKISRTVERDAEIYDALAKRGWRILTVWECALKGKTRLPLADVIEQSADWLRQGTANRLIEGKRHVAD